MRFFDFNKIATDINRVKTIRQTKTMSKTDMPYDTRNLITEFLSPDDYIPRGGRKSRKMKHRKSKKNNKRKSTKSR
jgi:hypothetical protein